MFEGSSVMYYEGLGSRMVDYYRVVCIIAVSTASFIVE
jgi:hypothetical protein